MVSCVRALPRVAREAVFKEKIISGRPDAKLRFRNTAVDTVIDLGTWIATLHQPLCIVQIVAHDHGCDCRLNS